MSEKQGIIKAVVVLVVICLVISGALAVVNSFTAPVSAANAEARETAARQELIPEAGSFEQVTDGLPENVLSAYVGKAADGSVAGYVITTSGKGFGGTDDPSLQDAGRFQRNEDARRPDSKRELLWPV